MPFRYEIDKESGLVLLVASGIARDEELLDANQKLMADPDLRHCTMELDDWRAVTGNELSTSCLRRMAEAWQKRDRHLEGAKLAWLVPRDVDFGVSRIYQVLRDGAPIEVESFRELADAERWLGLPVGYVDGRGARGV